MKTYGSIQVVGSEEIKETFRRREWGPISWHERLSRETIGVDLIIQTDRTIRNVYLNGVKIEVCMNGGKEDFSNPPSIKIANSDLIREAMK